MNDPEDEKCHLFLVDHYKDNADIMQNYLSPDPDWTPRKLTFFIKFCAFCQYFLTKYRQTIVVTYVWQIKNKNC